MQALQAVERARSNLSCAHGWSRFMLLGQARSTWVADPIDSRICATWARPRTVAALAKSIADRIASHQQTLTELEEHPCMALEQRL